MPRKSGAPNWPTLFVVTIVAAVLMNVAHEGGHAIANKLLGYDMVIRINSVFLAGEAPLYNSVRDRMIADAAGPLVTVAIAALAWLRGRRGRWRYAPTIVGTALVMRVIAAAVSVGRPNDEARISLALGLGKWAIFALVIGVLAAMLVALFRQRRLGWPWVATTYVALSLSFAAIVFGEAALPAVAW